MSVKKKIAVFKGGAVFCLLAALLLLGLGSQPAAGQFVLTVLDVGQGDALLLSAEGYNILIDAGGQPTDATGMAEYVVIPYLKAQGIGELTAAFNTHPDNDHIGGLFAVLDEIPVEQLAVFAGYTDSQRQQMLLELAAAREVPVLTVAAGDLLRFSEDFYIEVLSPPLESRFAPEEVNNGSLVLHIAYQDFDVLTTGDLVGEEMQAAIAGLACDDIEILQLPHHGSIYSYDEDWYGQFAPWAVFISVGRDNRYGHPGQAVVDYWQSRGVTVYRTDLQGSCRIIYQGGLVFYETAI